MVTTHRRRSGGCRTVGVLTWLLVAAVSALGYRLEKPAPSVGEGRSGGLTAQLHMTVHQGRLSVDLREAEVAEVLAWLGQAAGVLITGSPAAGERVSAQFTDVELEVGLRRLLRLAALSYAIRYAEAPTGVASVQEVRVFGAVTEEPLSPLNATARTGPDRTARSRAGPQPPAD
jgi:hypothetical protein